jgi:hypothetical protein
LLENLFKTKSTLCPSIRTLLVFVAKGAPLILPINSELHLLFYELF